MDGAIKIDALVDPTLIFQEQEHACRTTSKDEFISMKAMEKKRDEKKHQRINAVLKKTNYEEEMQKFVLSTSREQLLLKIDKDVSEDLDCFTFADIQDAVSNTCYARAYEEHGFVIWTYGKHAKVEKDALFKERGWVWYGVQCWFLSVILFIVCIAIAMFTDDDHRCDDHLVCKIAVLASFGFFLIGALGAPFWWTVHAWNLHHFFDLDYVNAFPAIRYRSQDI